MGISELKVGHDDPENIDRRSVDRLATFNNLTLNDSEGHCPHYFQLSCTLQCRDFGTPPIPFYLASTKTLAHAL